MQRFLCAAAAFLAVGTLVATAEDPRPARPADPAPKIEQPPRVVQPVQPRPVLVTAAKMAQLEEDYETLEAQRDVRKAHVRAAEIAVKATQITFELINKASGTGAAATDVNKARYDFEMAKAQLGIREAELKEIEVKLKFAKKRLDDAKAAGVRPAPGVRPLPVDPKQVDPLPPTRAAADEIAELKARLAKLQVEFAKKVAEVKKTEAELETAKAQAVALGKPGVPPEVIVKARQKVADATDLRDTLVRQQDRLTRELDELKEKLKTIEK